MTKKTGDTNKTKQSVVSEKRPRKVKQAHYTSFGLQKKIKRQEVQPLPNAFRLTAQSFRLVKRRWRSFAGIIAIYGALNIVLVQGFGAGASDDAVASTNVQLDAISSIFQVGGGTDNGSVYQSILLTLVTLALIWGLREAYAGQKFSIKDAYYKSMYPLVPFLLVIFIIMAQLIPLALGGTAFTIALQNGIAASGVEIAIWTSIVILLALLSIYLISASLFALLLVTLPDMTPLKALRAAKQLVANRRAAVIRKLLFIPLVLVVVFSILMAPIIVFIPDITQWVFLPLMIIVTPFVYAYIYALYREMM